LETDPSTLPTTCWCRSGDGTTTAAAAAIETAVISHVS
jgi:hypothetical protein